MKHILIAVLLLPCPFAFAQPKDKSPIVFEILDGKANGSEAILDARKAEIVAKKGDKITGHDWWLWGLTAIDYDNDGDPDFLVTIHGPAGHGVVLRNNFKETGKLTFTNVTKDLGVDWMLPSAEGRRTFVWDFDGDGWLDFAGCHTPSFLNDKGKRFTPTAKKEFGSFSPQAIRDLNGDGHPDVYNSSGQNGIWNPATKMFDVQNFTHPLEAKMPESVLSLWKDKKGVDKNRFLRVKYDTDHDLDGDGVNEVILSGYGSYGGDVFGRVLRQRKDGAFVDHTQAMALPATGAPILVADLDGDGHLDMLIAATADSGFYRNDGTGKFKLQPGPLTELLKSRDSYLHRADAADFDRDGLLDLVISKPRAGPKVIFANRGDGVFEVLHTLKAWDSDPVCICDLNDDGLLDVAVGGPGNNVTLYLNKTANPGRGIQLSPRMDGPNRNAVGAKIEAFRAGTLGQSGARPFLREWAHADATPITIGLGKSDRLDLRVTFPGSAAPLELKNIEARDRMIVTPKGLESK